MMVSQIDPTKLNEILDYYDRVLKKKITRFTETVADFLQSNEDMQRMEPLVKIRIKTRESLKRKIEAKYDPDNFLITKASLTQTIEDLGGIRIIVYKRPDIERVIKVVEGMDILENSSSLYSIKEKKPYFLAKKRFEWNKAVGQLRDQLEEREIYRSTHFILRDRLSVDYRIRCELQIRTIFDEAVFENYHKLVYKSGDNKYITTIMNNIAEECQLIDDLITQCYFWFDEEH